MLMSLLQSFLKLKKKTNKELVIKFIQWDKPQLCCNVSCSVLFIMINFAPLFSTSLGSYTGAYTSQPCFGNFSSWFMLHEISLYKSSVSTAEQEHAHADTHMQVQSHLCSFLRGKGAIKSVIDTKNVWTSWVFSKIYGKKKPNLLSWH